MGTKHRIHAYHTTQHTFFITTSHAFPLFLHFVDDFLFGCVLETEGRRGWGVGYTHSRGVAFLEGGCDERDAGKKKEGTDGRVEGSNFLGKALAKCRAHLSCNLHSHTHQRFLEGGSGEVFWVSVLVVLISGKGERGNGRIYQGLCYCS